MQSFVKQLDSAHFSQFRFRNDGKEPLAFKANNNELEVIFDKTAALAKPALLKILEKNSGSEPFLSFLIHFDFEEIFEGLKCLFLGIYCKDIPFHRFNQIKEVREIFLLEDRELYDKLAKSDVNADHVSTSAFIHPRSPCAPEMLKESVNLKRRRWVRMMEEDDD